jgi:hypothetical protein
MSSSQKRSRLLLAILTPAPIAITALFATAPAGAASQTDRLQLGTAHAVIQKAVLPEDPRQLAVAKKGGGSR